MNHKTIPYEPDRMIANADRTCSIELSRATLPFMVAAAERTRSEAEEVVQILGPVAPESLGLCWASQQGRWVCARCNDGRHFKKCFLGVCDCACRNSVPKHPPKPRRDRNPLTEEERRNQVDFLFDKHQPLEVK